MTIDDVKQRMQDFLPADVVEERVRTWQESSGDGDPGGLLEALVESGELTRIQRSAILTGMPADLSIGPYRLLDEVGLGRIGRTFRAVHGEFDQPVSLKLFPAAPGADSERANQLARETRVAVQVQNPHVLRTFQVGRVDRFVFLVMEDLAGETLADRLRREGRLPFLESMRIARQIALGLAHLHEREIVHRDVQPKNVWLHADGRALLTEFAAASDALEYLDHDPEAEDDGTFTFTEDDLANYDFLSAEQGVDRSFADERSDLYSLGCILFRCLTGEVVFPDANPVRKMLRHALTEAPSVSDVGESRAGVDEVVAMLLEKSPEDRYQQAGEVAWALEQLIARDVEHAVAVDEVNPEFLAWANSTPDLEADASAAGVVGDREFLDFLGHLVDEDEEDEESPAERGVGKEPAVENEPGGEDESLDASEGTLI